MLKREMKDGTLILRLDRPEKLNAWDAQLRDAVKNSLNEINDDESVRAVVITGTGPKAFCAGADLSDGTIGVASAASDRMAAYRELYISIQSFRKPLVAALNGLAVGSAFQAILLMDYRIGHKGVRLGLPEINSGMPCITGSAILSWSIGPVRALNIATSGRFVGTEEALHLGVIDEVVAPEKVLDRAVAVAGELAQKPPHSFAETKLWFRDMMQPALNAAFDRAGKVRASTGMSQSIQAGVQGFFDRSNSSETRN